ncbi:S9 family peptidase [Microbacterium sp. bgisy203]|uniref:S9 family peptidase n=1 Tax=Microbacterium sp. bgisy203 TaxID=3413799 RepID=UPI003D76269D
MVTVSTPGSWPSPLSAEWASAASPRFEGAAFVGDEVWWGESLPAEGGRTTVRRRTAAGDTETVLPAPWNARSSVHEYGGGAWAATGAGALAFVEKSDQRVWLLTPGAEPRPLTPEDPATRYGGLRFSHGALLAVREWHGDGAAVRRGIVRITVDDSPHVLQLVAGSDFVAQPALSPDGSRLAWVAWNHPHMPWDRTEVRVGRLTDDRVTSWASMTDGTTAALQPEWRGDDEIVYLDEPTGRWNIWHRVSGPDGFGEPSPLAEADADTGGPLWALGSRWYALLPDGRIAAIRTHGADELVLIDADGTETIVDLPATARLSIEDAAGDGILVSGAGVGSTGIWLVGADGAVTQVAGSSGDAEWMPVGRPVTFAGPHGEVHAFDFPPTNPDAAAAEGALPPYVVFVHGGPTAHAGGVADAKTAFFTSRGIGVLDVNYGGSTGYGRAYRERLRGQWGIVDVDDVAAAARGLIDAGLADPARIAIEGGSAGGWTVLGALVGTDVFSVGISRYGVGDARALAEDTHDFEARYLDGLIGPLPEAEALYRERSPLGRANEFRTPTLLLQGSEDAVVPPAQSEAIRDALAARGVPHAYVLYEGEGHGFRRRETIVHSLESELAFLGAVFGFDTPGIPPIALD